MNETDLVNPLFVSDGIARPARPAFGAGGTVPPSVRYGAQADAVRVVAAVAIVAKQHLLLVRWVVALGTRLAICVVVQNTRMIRSCFENVCKQDTHRYIPKDKH